MSLLLETPRQEPVTRAPSYAIFDPSKPVVTVAALLSAFGAGAIEVKPAYGDHFQVLNPTARFSEPTQADGGSTMNARDQDRPGSTSPHLWQQLASSSAWTDALPARVGYLASKPSGWKGEDSVAPTDEARADALALLEVLQVEAPHAVPMISLDEEGEFVFYWKGADYIASMAVTGDGTYTFFGNRGGPDVIYDALPLAAPLNPEVLEILSPRRTISVPT